MYIYRMKTPILFGLLAVFLSCDPVYKVETKVKLELKPGALNSIELPAFVPNAPVDSFWVKKNYQYARVYLYSGANSYDSIIKGGRLHSTVITKNGFLLNKEESERINFNLQNGKASSDTLGPADCFQPHHGIVYYNSRDKPVGHISACFLCNDMKVFPVANKFSLDTLRDLFDKKGIPVFEEGEIYKYQEYKN